MQWQIGSTWVRDARVRQDAAVVSSAAAEDSARQAQLVSEFADQLAKGEAEKARVEQKLEAVRLAHQAELILWRDLRVSVRALLLQTTAMPPADCHLCDPSRPIAGRGCIGSYAKRNQTR